MQIPNDIRVVLMDDGTYEFQKRNGAGVWETKHTAKTLERMKKKVKKLYGDGISISRILNNSELT